MSLLRCVVSLLLLVTVTRASPILNNADVSNNIDSPRAEIKYRLDNNVKPEDYKLEIDAIIGPDDDTFSGKVGITLYLTKATTEIKLHAKYLTINETLTSILHMPKGTDKPVPVPTVINPIKHSYDRETEVLTLTFAELLKEKRYLLSLDYTGEFHDDRQGFYKGSYTTDYGEKVWLAMTQFEPTHARRAFPCFDEPEFKATFHVTIKHLPRYKAVSNTPVATTVPDKDDFPKVSTTFEVTPKMSTYLVAFVISDFKFKSSEDGKFNVWARENAIHTGKYALGIGPKELKHLAGMLGNEPLLPKMDNFALPQFKANAMENWGLVTYRESRLLYEEGVTTTAEKQAIAAVISHEFAHQWFGNLVTPAWWDDVWLSEGFANYFEYYTTDKIEPTWRLMDRFVIKNLQDDAFTADDYVNQHPLDATVNSPAEIRAIFDSISYSKGGCVIRMISHAITEPVFQKALKQYLSANEFEVVTSQHLMSAFTSAAGSGGNKPTVDQLKRWTKQAGYPVVTVTRDHKTGQAVIKQERFLTVKPTEPRKEIWSVPLTWTTQKELDFIDTSARQWLHEKETKITGLQENVWVIFNKQQTGYYRVNYDAQNWKLISDYLKTNESTKIHELNRAQLLDDSFHLSQAGQLENYTTFFDISEYLQEETDYAPWHAAYRAFGVLDKALANTKEHELFKLYVRRLIEKVETKLGYRVSNETETDVDVFNRLNAISLACAMGSPKCLEDTRNQLADHVSGTTRIPTDLRKTVYCAGLRSNDRTLWAATLAYGMEIKSETERDLIVSSLGCSSNVDDLKLYLSSTLSPNSTISRDSVFRAVYDGSSAGPHVAFDFIKENLKEILKTDSDKTAVLNYLNAIGRRMTTDEHVEQLKAFIESLKKDHAALAGRLEKDALKRATDNAAWLKQYEGHIEAFLSTQELIPQEVTTAEPDSSNISLPTFSLIAFVTLLGSGVTRAYGF